MASAVAFAVEAVSEGELIVHLPDSVCRDPRFFHRLAAYLAHDDSPAVRLDRRDELIREAVARFYSGTPRARAISLLQDANRYAATGWRHHRTRTKCPDELIGSVRELLWHAFKTHPRFPTGLRQLQAIIAQQ
jgi:hypothetical protein